MSPFTITERSPISQQILNSMNAMRQSGASNYAVRRTLMCQIIKNVPNATSGIVRRYLDAMS